MSVPSIIRLNSTVPAAPAGYANVKPQHDSGFPIDNTSFYAPNLGAVDARITTTETIRDASLGKLVTLTNAGAIAVTLDSAHVPASFMCWVSNLGAGTATLTPSSGTIDGGVNLPLTTNQGVALFWDGTNWKTSRGISSAVSVVHKVGVTIDGAGSAITTGVKGSIQVDFAGTIIGWSIEADQVGSIQVDVDKHSGTQTSPSVPNTSTDKISGSAPIALSSAQAAGVGTSGVSTWGTTAVAQWDSIQFNVTSATTVQRVTLYLRIQE